MDIALLKKAGFAALLMALSVAQVLARTPESARGMPSQPVDYRQPDDNDFDYRDVRPSQLQEPDDSSRRGKLSPDARRELRRQIDEAGQDIYRLKR